MNTSRLFTMAGIVMVLVSLALAAVGYLLASLIVLGTVALGGLFMILVALKSGR